MAEREEARAGEGLRAADAIRDRLAELGWEVRDSAEGAAARAERARWPTRSSTGAGRLPRRSGGGGGCTGSGGRRRRRLRSWSGSAGSPDHQGVVAEVDPYPYGGPERAAARRGRAAGRPRPGPGPAQPRRRLPLGRVRRRRRAWSCRSAARPPSPPSPARPPPARSSTSQVAHVRNLADWLADGQGRRLLDLGRRRRGRAVRLGRRPQGPDRARPRRRGQRAPPPGRRRPATA